MAFNMYLSIGGSRPVPVLIGANAPGTIDKPIRFDSTPLPKCKGSRRKQQRGKHRQ